MAMSSDEINFLEQQQAEIANLQAKFRTGETQQYQQSMTIEQQEKGMVKEQLDLGEELERIENLLKGNILEYDPQTKKRKWTAPKDNEMVVLSPYGIHLILNVVNWYLNKNTLLSNYDEETINTKMEDFATDLADTIFMEYEKVFQYPSFEDCKKILEARLQNKVKLKSYAEELLGRKPNKDEIEEALVDEMEGNIEREIEKIKEQVIKNKLKRFLITLRTVQDSIHSTYLRALGGKERSTIREHVHISEARGGSHLPESKSGFSLLNLLPGRR